jgi:hypothetical protein
MPRQYPAPRAGVFPGQLLNQAGTPPGPGFNVPEKRPGFSLSASTMRNAGALSRSGVLIILTGNVIGVVAYQGQYAPLRTSLLESQFLISPESAPPRGSVEEPGLARGSGCNTQAEDRGGTKRGRGFSLPGSSHFNPPWFRTDVHLPRNFLEDSRHIWNVFFDGLQLR